MQQYNLWVECLNCGEDYWVDEALHSAQMVACPGCASTKYMTLESDANVFQEDFRHLHESLMEDGDWN